MACSLFNATTISSKPTFVQLQGLLPLPLLGSSKGGAASISSLAFTNTTPRSVTGLVLFRDRGIVRVVTEKTEFQQDTGGGDGGFGTGGGGGGGGGGGDDDDSREDDEEEGDSEKKSGMSMSQKLTLAYAALVGVGGLMGYIKGGSQKSLAAGGLSALLLCYVYTQLPVRPAFASSLGLGLSAALLGVMGSRFKNSGKVFPAGVVSFVSLVMTGGYLHGIMRGMHA